MQRATRGEVTISPSATQDFADECKESVDIQLNRKREYRIRMSGLGRPLCQQLLERSGLVEEMDYNALFRFLFGDLVESVAVLIMEQAGVEIVEKQKAVSLNIAGQTINGTLDLILRDEMGIDKVWDVKSASEWAFKFKYTGYGGYDKIKEDDPFGYIGQISAYAEANGIGGKGVRPDEIIAAFLVIDKSTGEICLTPVRNTEKDNATHRVNQVKGMVSNDHVPDRCYDPLADGESGNLKLAMGCIYCSHKRECWSDANQGKGLRAFKYARGLNYLVKVSKEPKVEEVMNW